MTTRTCSNDFQNRSAVRQRLTGWSAWAAAAMLAVASGCTESPEVRIEKARIALQNNQLESVEKLADSVLRENGQSVEALELLAESALRRRDLETSGKFIEQLLTLAPDSVEGHRKMIKLTRLYMHKAFSQTDFMENEALQRDFDRALDLGKREIEWMARNADSLAESRYLLAQFAEIEAMRLRRALEHVTRTLSMRDGSVVASSGDVAQRADQLRRELDQKLSEAVDFLRAALDVDPRNYEAAAAMLRIHSDRDDHRAIWELGQRLARQEDIPADLSEEVMLRVLMIPPDMQPVERRVELSRQLQASVATGQRKGSVYKLTDARLDIVEEKIDSASKIIDEVLKSEPTNVMALFLKGQALYAAKEHQQAKAILEKLVLQRGGSTPRTWRLYGLVLMQTGDNEMAREALRRAIELSGGEDILSKQALFAHLVSTGNYAVPAEELGAMLKKTPDDPQALRLKLQLDIGQGNREAVNDLMEMVKKISPPTDAHLSVLVDGYRYLKNWSEVLRYGRQLAAMRPEMLEAHMTMAEAYMAQGDMERCQRVLTDLRTSHPGATSVDQMLGRLYLSAQAFDKAKDVLETVVQRDPDNHVARTLLVRALASLTMTEAALEHLDKVLESHPDDLEANALAARIYQFAGNSAKAEEHIARLDPALVDEAQHPVLKAQMELRKGNLDVAKAICHRAIAMSNNDPVLRLTLASLYSREGDEIQAEKQLRQLVEAQPDNPVSYALLSRYFAGKQQLEKGILTLEDLSRNNEPLARLAQATLYNHFGQFPNAIRHLEPIYPALVRAREPRALAVADALARTHLLNRDRKAAIQVFTPLIEADYKATEAMLRQIDLEREVITRDELLERLVTLSKRLTPDQRELRFEVFSRVSRLDLNESIRMLDDWIRLESGEAVLYRWKGEALAGVGRLEEALTAFNQGIEVDPSNAALYARMAQVHRLRVDHPAAEAILRRMAKIDSGARIAAMTQLGQMFAALGLNAQALEAMGELDDQSRQRDPRVLLAMGGAYGQLGQYEKSLQALADVPRFAPQYAPAQILMARNERRSGRIDNARQRLQALMADPRLRQTAANELLMLQLSTDRDDLLMEWADTFLSVDSLAPEMKVRWLTVRTTISVRNAQWETALAALEQLETLSPHEKYTAARVLVLMQTGKFELARRIFRNSSTLQDSPMGRPLAVVLGADAGGQAPGGLMTYLESIYRGDVDAARSAIDSVPPLPTVFKADLRATLDRADIRTPEMAEAARSTIAAVLANTVGMTRLAAEFCRQALDKMPSFTIAQAMLMHALFELGDPIDPVLEIARKTPGSSVAMYVIAVDEGVAGRAPQAAKAFETLAAQEPENHFLAYRKAEYQQKAENFEAAIQTLEGIVKSETAGDHQLMASNDLAYQLAIHKPERMDEAADLARRALERALTNPAIQDTMGWILHLQGNHEDAGKLLNLAIQALRDRPEVHYHLAKVYEALGNPTWMRYHAQAAAAGPRQIKEVGLAADLLSK